MDNKPIFYDSDVLICFLEINETTCLKKLFSKIILPKQVYQELTNKNTPINIRNNLNILINDNFVEINDFEFASEEFIKFECISKGYWSNGNPIGLGESAAIAFAIENNGIVASNNLSDIFEICDDYNIPILTASIILSFCYELNVCSKDKINEIWDKILTNTYQIMPKSTFEEYYTELFEKDCEKLLRNYDFKHHYMISKKRKKAKI